MFWNMKWSLVVEKSKKKSQKLGQRSERREVIRVWWRKKEEKIIKKCMDEEKRDKGKIKLKNKIKKYYHNIFTILLQTS